MCFNFVSFSWFYFPGYIKSDSRAYWVFLFQLSYRSSSNRLQNGKDLTILQFPLLELCVTVLLQLCSVTMYPSILSIHESALCFSLDTSESLNILTPAQILGCVCRQLGAPVCPHAKARGGYQVSCSVSLCPYSLHKKVFPLNPTLGLWQAS